MRGDRGAQAVIAAEAAEGCNGVAAQVRSVEVRLEPVPLEQLQWPANRSPRQLSTVEASLRLDAVASAGLGLSRNRMAEQIRAGAVRVNWQVVTSPSRELRTGDRVRIDLKKRTANILISDEELAKRRAGWKAPAPRYLRGVQAKFAFNASSASPVLRRWTRSVMPRGNWRR